jgi:hypothetical protein
VRYVFFVVKFFVVKKKTVTATAQDTVPPNASPFSPLENRSSWRLKEPNFKRNQRVRHHCPNLSCTILACPPKNLS